MNTLDRILTRKIKSKLLPNKVILLFGARRVGKTVLIRQIIQDFEGKVMILNGEDEDSITLLNEKSISNYRNLLKGIDVLVIDEAQNINEIGLKLKLMVDEIDQIRIIASGSSSFDLNNKAGEPLVGRSFTYLLFPFSQQELSVLENLLETRRKLESRLIFGTYPEVELMESNENKMEYLKDMVNSYLLKDILAIEGIRNSGKMRELLRLIAFQTGNEVSYEELGKQLSMSKNTVEKYLDLLSKVFIIYRLGAFSRNLRKEVTKAGKWYFYDNGIRNALISNFNPLVLRQDIGQLWESYLISERMKNKYFNTESVEYYFWRTYDGQEIDLIEESGNQITAIEFKYSERNVKIPRAFSETYPEASFKQVHKENYLQWLLNT
ncbi:MAG: ATP-binding protein [Bacteroidota bacterium]|nr:ATP-binding protein [Bacteroidota bacterium]